MCPVVKFPVVLVPIWNLLSIQLSCLHSETSQMSPQSCQHSGASLGHTRLFHISPAILLIQNPENCIMKLSHSNNPTPGSSFCTGHFCVVAKTPHRNYLRGRGGRVCFGSQFKQILAYNKQKFPQRVTLGRASALLQCRTDSSGDFPPHRRLRVSLYKFHTAACCNFNWGFVCRCIGKNWYSKTAVASLQMWSCIG